MKKTGEKAVDLTVEDYVSRSDNPEQLSLIVKLLFPIDTWPLTSFLAMLAHTTDFDFFKPGFLKRVEGGFEYITTALLNNIAKMPNVTTCLNQKVVTVVEESSQRYLVKVILNI
mgnify:CR=1 FL=1